MASVVYAHRGASGYAPENTLEAFRLAMDMGADGFELDVHLSRDGELIVMHDETVDRTTNGTGRIMDKTAAELKELDACNGMEKYKGAKIPTLAEVFALIQGTKLLINCELKTDNIQYPGIEEKCLKLAEQMGVESQLLYSSFNHYSLMKLKALNPNAPTGALYSNAIYQPWDYVKPLGIENIHPHWGNLYLPGLIEGCLKAGVGINPWTVNEEAVMKLCIHHGIGVITNYPDKALAFRAKNEG